MHSLFDLQIPFSFASEVKVTWDRGKLEKRGNVLLFWEEKANKAVKE